MRLFLILVLSGVVSSGVCKNAGRPHGFRWSARETEKPKPERTVCDTQQCKELAKSIIEGMNRTVDPCEDFYQYACGNWEKYNPLPEGETHWNIMAKLQKKVEDRLKAIIEEDPQPEDIHAVKLTKLAFKACMDIGEMDRAGLQPLVSTLWGAGGWPLIMEEDEWDERIYKWQNVDDYYARLIGRNSFHDLIVDINYWTYNETNLYVKTPDVLSSMYKLINPEEIGVDSIEEDESGEGSQERGSEQREDDAEEGGEEDEDIDGYKLGGKVNGRLRKYRTETSIDLDAGKARKKSSSESRRNPVQLNNEAKSSKISETRSALNDDLFFDGDVKEDGNEKNVADKKGDNEDERVVGNDNDIDENGSGSGDHEGDDEESNGDDGDGSGDDTDDGEECETSSEVNRRRIEDARKKYKEYILNVSIALSEARGVPISKNKLCKDIADMVQLQMKIIEYSFVYANRKNTTLATLQRKYDALKPATSNGKINWIRKVQDLFINGGMEIDENAYIYVLSFDYLKALRRLLDRTPSRVIVNYVHWNYISRVLHSTSSEMRSLYYDWHDREEDDSQRKDTCVKEIDAKYILGYEYVKRYVPERILQTASDMIDNIQKEVEHDIKGSSWLDAEIREFILDKLVYMEKTIGYPDSYLNKTYIRELYKGLSVTKSHYGNTLSIMRYMNWKNLRVYFTKNLGNELDMDPLTVNAFFSPYENTIEITAADFQKPFYEVGQPWYTNYGIIGLIMAHEVNHGFDNSGRFFDKQGRPAEWSPDMKEEYDKRLRCFVDQFTRYSVVENKTGNITIEDYGVQTAGENIADTMGLKAAFKAYLRRERKCDTPDPMLPGLEDLSNEQLFFLSFAHVWCEVSNPEALSKLLKHDPHSQGLLRVIGSVSNSEDFAKAYNCPLGSPMNPIKKCSIWE